MRHRDVIRFLKKLRKETGKEWPVVEITRKNWKIIAGCAMGTYAKKRYGDPSCIIISDGSLQAGNACEVLMKEIREIKKPTLESMNKLLWQQYKIARKAVSAGKEAEAVFPFRQDQG